MDEKRIKRLSDNLLFWLVVAGLLTTAVFFLILAPEEATLGSGIRSVYVHVSLMWTGMVGLAVTAVVALLALLTNSPRFAGWLAPFSWVAAGFYTAGVVTSAIASRVNWGNIFWQEPRMAAAFNNLALVVIVVALNVWLPWPRLRALLLILLPLGVAWFTWRAPLVLHPRNPIFSSEATGIQLAFIGMFLLMAGLAAWIAWRLVRQRA